MRDARQIINREVEQREMDELEFNEELLPYKKCLKIIKFYESRKLDVLSILSNPWKHHFDKKDLFVLELAVEEAKIEDQIYLRYGKLEFMLFVKACRHYDLMSKKNKTILNRDAEVIANNVGVKLEVN